MATTMAVCSNLNLGFVLQKHAKSPNIHTGPENLHEISQCNGEIGAEILILPPSRVVRSGNPSARQRRLAVKRQKSSSDATALQLTMPSNPSRWRNPACLAADCLPQYGNGLIVGNGELVSPDHAIRLYENIRVGVQLEECTERLQENLGYEPSYIQLGAYMNISQEDLASKLFEYSMAIDKLVKANIRLVISVARKYENMGIDIADLIQVGLFGLVRGLKKFDYTKGVKLSTYVHWWIRQGIVIFLTKYSRAIRFPDYLHHLLSSFQNIKMLLADEDTPMKKIAMTLSISDTKLKKFLKAKKKIISLDTNTHTMINRDPCGVVQDYIMDSNIDNQPWYKVTSQILKEDINNLIKSALDNRERMILRLYFGLDTCDCSWEAIGRRLGLSRERVRQVGLEAIQKLKNAAIYNQLTPLSMQY